MKETVFNFWRCDMGSQWTTTGHPPAYRGDWICNFSGCASHRHSIQLVSQGTSYEEAQAWFKRYDQGMEKVAHDELYRGKNQPEIDRKAFRVKNAEEKNFKGYPHLCIGKWVVTWCPWGTGGPKSFYNHLREALKFPSTFSFEGHGEPFFGPEGARRYIKHHEKRLGLEIRLDNLRFFSKDD